MCGKEVDLIKALKICFICLFLFISCTDKELRVGEVAIIPKPQEQVIGEGYFEFDSNTKIAVENEEQLKIVDRILTRFKKLSGWKPIVSISNNGDINFITDSSLPAEAYVLNVMNGKIEVKAASGPGFFYAMESMKQLFPVEFFGKDLNKPIRWGIPVVYIKDRPKFEWRGYMLDVSRHFFDVEQVKAVIDFMAESKLNRFHWHLTDDQGWRIEIKSFPKLTEVGSWRVDYNVTDETISNWFGRPRQKQGEKATYGGFYTQDDIKEIISYAKDRYIEVIPEIDMPGHSQAIVASYPELGCVNAEYTVATGGVVRNNTLNPGKEETYEFAENMLNEVMDLFPFDYIHIGGDECNKEQWRVDPDAQQKILKEGLKNEAELQSYFIKRMEEIINARGRKMIGWDEIHEGGLAPNATVMSWRGELGGISAVKSGHEVIMTPSNFCYIDLKQGHDDLEPNLGYSELLLSTSYNYKVVPDSLTAQEAQLIKGTQANMWTESISDWGKLTYMTFPRLFAIAENAWTEHSEKDWDDFSDRLLKQFERMDTKNIRYAVSAFSPWIDHEGNGKNINISLKTEVKGLDIRYTLDGTTPTKQSLKYEGTFIIDKTKEVKARAFKKDKPVGYISNLKFPVHLAAGAKVLDHSNDKTQELLKLTDLNYGRLKQEDPSWQYLSNNAEVVIYLDSITALDELKFEALRYTISGIYAPTEVEVSGSIDDFNYTPLGNMYMPEAGIQGRNKIEYRIPLSKNKVKSIKIKVKTPSPIPKGHHMAGSSSIIAIDELILN
tara:strand:- start:25983 stop:28319 length:2337 start_codon:yes stop_codon:yes gene_type:complete